MARKHHEAVALRPSRVRVGPFDWTIRYEAPAEEMNAVALTLLPTLTILIDPNFPEPLLRETLLHEVMHACHLVLGVVNSEADITSEAFISLVSPTLFAVMRDNPHFTAYLTQED